MRLKLLIFSFAIAITTGPSAKADIFGGDVAVLVQILEENIRHYYQLQQMISQGQNAESFWRAIHSGLDNSIGLLNSLPVKDDQILADLRQSSAAMSRIESIYGKIPKSSMQTVQTVHDQTVAESIRMANDFKNYSDVEDKNSALITEQARDASPKGAARMQVEMSAHILQSLAQLIRLDTQMLKLQSEELAFANKRSKDGVANYQQVDQDLGSGFSNFSPDLNLERF